MNDDPRWQLMADFVAWATASEGAGDSSEYGRRFQEYVAAAETIAADEAVPAKDRAVARRILATIDTIVRANAPALLAAAAKLARDPTVADDIRAEAADSLARVTEHMPAASDKLH